MKTYRGLSKEAHLKSRLHGKGKNKMTVETKNSIELEKIMPDFRRFAANKSASRKVLQNIKIADGYVSATDSHKAIRINREHINMEVGGNDLINTITGKLSSDTDFQGYPELGRLFPVEHRTELSMRKGDLKGFRDVLKRALTYIEKDRQGIKRIELALIDGIAKLQIEKSEEIIFSEDLDVTSSGDDLEILLDGTKLSDILITINKLRKLSGEDERITFGFSGNKRPIIITDRKSYEVLLCPVLRRR